MSENVKCIAFIGCGYMAKAMLAGMLENSKSSILSDCRYEATVTSEKSAEKLKKEFSAYSTRVNISVGGNVPAAKKADIVVLSVPPNKLKPTLDEPGVARALKGKFIISILAGISREQIEEGIKKHMEKDESTQDTHIVRVNPSLGTQASESASLVAIDEPPLPASLTELNDKILAHIGRTHYVPGNLFDSVMAMTAVVHATVAIAVDAIADGSTVAGIPRENVLEVVGQCFKGYGSLLAQGKEPADLKKSLMIPYGFTANAMLRLERRGVRAALSDAVIDIVDMTK